MLCINYNSLKYRAVSVQMSVCTTFQSSYVRPELAGDALNDLTT